MLESLKANLATLPVKLGSLLVFLCGDIDLKNARLYRNPFAVFLLKIHQTSAVKSGRASL